VRYAVCAGRYSFCRAWDLGVKFELGRDLELKFWLPFIRGVRVFAPFLDDFAKNGASLNVIAFYACAAPFWICFFAAVFCLNYGRADFGRLNLIVTGGEIPRAWRILFSCA